MLNKKFKIKPSKPILSLLLSLFRVVFSVWVEIYPVYNTIYENLILRKYLVLRKVGPMMAIFLRTRYINSLLCSTFKSFADFDFATICKMVLIKVATSRLKTRFGSKLYIWLTEISRFTGHHLIVALSMNHVENWAFFGEKCC